MNSFTSGGPNERASVAYGDLNVDQENVLKLVKSQLQKPLHIQRSSPLLLIVAGLPGGGKTAVINHMQAVLKEHT
ncbi:unnamed protein product, partial [Allacma fusca]